MSIFNKTKPVAGLFNDDAGIERVLEQLQAKGYGLEDEEDLVIIDKAWIETEIFAEAKGFVNPAGHSSPGGVAAVPQPLDPTPETNSKPTQSWVEAIKTAIADVGIDDEAAEFFARRVVQGGKVIIVQVDEKEAGEIQRLFEEVGQARTMVDD